MLEVALAPPVGLQQDAVDLLEVDRLRAVADSFHHWGDGEISDTPEDAFAEASDEVEGGEKRRWRIPCGTRVFQIQSTNVLDGGARKQDLLCKATSLTAHLLFSKLAS
jgi:hypothetical protein